MTIIDFITDKTLLGGLHAFADLKTWAAWLIVLKATFGLPLTTGELETFKKQTGRTCYSPPVGGWREVVIQTGVQSGKSRIAGVLAGFSAITGERGTHATLLAQDHRGAMRVLLRYTREPFEVLPAFRAEVVREMAEGLELRNGVFLSTYPCRPAAVRGIRSNIVAIDELAFFQTSDGSPVDAEMVRVARGRVATTGGKIVILSSPSGQTGELYNLHKNHWGRDDSAVLFWAATSPEMNPTLPQDYLDRMRINDPEGYRSEVLGEFRKGISSLFDPDALDAVVVKGRTELPPIGGHEAFVDPSGMRIDAFTMAIGHNEGGRTVIDLVRSWPAPGNPSGVVSEIADLCFRYGVTQVTGDRYGGEWPREMFRDHGLDYIVADKPKSDLYLEMLAAVNSKSVELPDVSELIRELRGLERHRASSGKDRVDHRSGSHDDQANAVAGVVWMLLQHGTLIDVAPYSQEKTAKDRVPVIGYDPHVDADDDTDHRTISSYYR